MSPNPNDIITPDQFGGLHYLSTTDDIRYYWRTGNNPVFIAATIDDMVVARAEFRGRDEMRLENYNILEHCQHLGILEEILTHVEGIYGQDFQMKDSGYCDEDSMFSIYR